MEEEVQGYEIYAAEETAKRAEDILIGMGYEV